MFFSRGYSFHLYFLGNLSMKIFANCILKARLDGEICLSESCIRAIVSRTDIPENQEYLQVILKFQAAHIWQKRPNANNINCHLWDIVLEKMKTDQSNHSVIFIDQGKKDISCILSTTRQKFSGQFAEDTASQQYALQRYQYFSC